MGDKLGPGQIMGLAGAGLGLLQGGLGMIGMGKANRAADKSIQDISTYSTDPEVAKYLALRKRKVGTGLGADATLLEKQGIESAATQASSAAQRMGGGRGLGMIGAIQKGRQRGYEKLASKAFGAEQQNIAGLGQAIGMAGAERQRQFASEQEKQQLKANIALQKVAAKRAMVAQGLQGAVSGLTGAASASAV